MYPRVPCQSPPSTTGPSWLVWLRPRAAGPPNPREAGLTDAREMVVTGRCLLALPHDAVPFSWCRRGGQVALLYGHLLNRPDLQKRLELPTGIGGDAGTEGSGG